MKEDEYVKITPKFKEEIESLLNLLNNSKKMYN